MARPAFLANLPRPALVAHRGGGLLRPENTLEAFAHALELGADVLELDVRLSKDGQVVVIHDGLLDRTTDGSGPVEARTLGELRALDAGARFTRGGEAPFRGRGVRIPTFEEVLTAFPRARLNVELKTAAPGLLEGFAVLVERHRCHDRLCAGSALDEVAEQVRTRLPGLCLFYPELAARAWVLRAKGMTDVPEPPRYDVLELPFDLDGAPLVDAALVEAAHAEGIDVQVWTLNDAASMRRALEAGVDGIMTDEPALL
ncbi:MAG: glycerophosphodiester phosphodiesterase, partial [Myxococcales bacterium]